MSDNERKLPKSAERIGGRLEIIPVSQITTEARARVDMGNLQELALSLRERGQLQNLVVQDLQDGNYKLLAGGRRVEAMKLNKTEEAFCLVFDRELKEVEILLIEHEENSRRKDFTWEEDVALKARIKKLMTDEFGEKSCGMSDTGVSMRDVAAAIDVSPATMSLDLALARALETAPEIFEGCKTKKDARKQLSKLSELLVHNELCRRIEERAASSDSTALRVKKLTDRYITGDFFEHVKEIPDGCVNLIEIDPPYAIALKEIKQNYTHRYGDSYNEVAMDDYLPFIKKTLEESYRVLAENSFLLLWYAPEPWGPVMYRLLVETGFETTLLTCKWIKPTGQCQQPTKWLANACEEFFYARKGDPVIVRQGRTNIFNATPVAASKKIHPTERPVELMMEIISTFAWEGSRIMVPFAGSGATLIAAELLGMNAFGYDLGGDEYKSGFTVKVNELFEQGVLK